MTGIKPARKTILFLLIVAGHLLAVFGPAGCLMIQAKNAEKEEIPFKVKLGGFEPSHAPIVGPPERLRPTGQERNIPPPAPPEPVPAPPKPAIPKPDPAVEEARRKKAAEDARRKKAAEEARKKRAAEEARRKKAAEEARRKKAAEEARRKKAAEEARRKKAAEEARRRQQQVHHDSRWDNWDPNKPASNGGSNTNANVPIGTRDAGQRRGAVDSRTPAGGATADEQAYWAKVRSFFMDKWKPPAGIFVDETTQVQVTVEVNASGRVTRKWISKRSPNAAVNASAEALLKNLSVIPKPPNGATRFTLSLVQDY